MNRVIFYLIIVSVVSLFQVFVTEARAADSDCTITWVENADNYSPTGDIEITGNDPQYPFFRWTLWTLEDILEVSVTDREGYEIIYYIKGDIPETIQYGDYSQPGTSVGIGAPNPAPPLELNHDYEITFYGISKSGTYGFIIEGLTCISPPDISASKGDFVDVIELKWTVVQDATRYELYREDVLLYSGLNIEYHDIKTEGNYLDIDKKYEYTIRACTPEGCSDFNSVFGYLYSESKEYLTPILNLLGLKNERKRPGE